MTDTHDEMLARLKKCRPFQRLLQAVQVAYGVGLRVNAFEPWLLRCAQYFVCKSDVDKVHIDPADKDVVGFKCTFDVVHGDVCFGSVRTSSDDEEMEAALTAIGTMMRDYMVDNLDHVELHADSGSSKVVTIMDGDARRSFIMKPGQSIIISQRGIIDDDVDALDSIERSILEADED